MLPVTVALMAVMSEGKNYLASGLKLVSGLKISVSVILISGVELKNRILYSVC